MGLSRGRTVREARVRDAHRYEHLFVTKDAFLEAATAGRPLLVVLVGLPGSGVEAPTVEAPTAQRVWARPRLGSREKI